MKTIKDFNNSHFLISVMTCVLSIQRDIKSVIFQQNNGLPHNMHIAIKYNLIWSINKVCIIKQSKFSKIRVLKISALETFSMAYKEQINQIITQINPD